PIQHPERQEEDQRKEIAVEERHPVAEMQPKDHAEVVEKAVHESEARRAERNREQGGMQPREFMTPALSVAGTVLRACPCARASRPDRSGGWRAGPSAPRSPARPARCESGSSCRCTR